MLAQTTGVPPLAQQGFHGGERARVGGLEKGDVDVSGPGELLREDGLVTEPLDDVPEQLTHFCLGLADEDPHGLTIGFDRADRGGICLEAV